MHAKKYIFLPARVNRRFGWMCASERAADSGSPCHRPPHDSRTDSDTCFIHIRITRPGEARAALILDNPDPQEPLHQGTKRHRILDRHPDLYTQIGGLYNMLDRTGTGNGS